MYGNVNIILERLIENLCRAIDYALQGLGLMVKTAYGASRTSGGARRFTERLKLVQKRLNMRTSLPEFSCQVTSRMPQFRTTSDATPCSAWQVARLLLQQRAAADKARASF